MESLNFVQKNEIWLVEKLCYQQIIRLQIIYHIYVQKEFALNNPQRLICHKTQSTKPHPTVSHLL